MEVREPQHSLASYVAGVALAASGFGMIAIGTLCGRRHQRSADPADDGAGGGWHLWANPEPLYLGTTLIYLGLSVAAGSLWAIGLLVPLLWVINVGVVKREERYLERKFGDAYRDYKAWVRRWI